MPSENVVRIILVTLSVWVGYVNPRCSPVRNGEPLSTTCLGIKLVKCAAPCKICRTYGKFLLFFQNSQF